MIHLKFTGRIRIINPPRGSIRVPFEIRKAWEQLELPCSPVLEMVTPKKIPLGRPPLEQWVYMTRQTDAISILMQHNPAAAEWWKTNGYPKGEDYFFSISEHDAITLEESVHRAELVNFIAGLGGHVE